MKKFTISIIMIIFIFNMFYPTIYAIENVIENEELEITSEEELDEIETENIVKETSVNNEIENNFVIVEDEKTEIIDDELDEPQEEKIFENVIEENKIEEVEIPIEVEEEIVDNNINYTGTMYIDAPTAQNTYIRPDVSSIKLAGWAVSDDKEAVLKLYVNGVYWRNLDRTIERGDVNRVYPQYASTTTKAGFTYDMPAEAFPEGIHEIRVDEVSRVGKLICSTKVNMKVVTQNFSGAMYIDTPTVRNTYTRPDVSSINLAGWAVSDDKESVLKLYVNGVYWRDLNRTIEREDVNRVYPQYASTTTKAGFTYDMPAEAFPEGIHEIRVDEVSRVGKLICSAKVNMKVVTQNFSGAMYIDTPTIKNTYTRPNVSSIKLSGWAVSDDKEAVLKLYVNGVYWRDLARTIERGDVNRVYPQYASATTKAGFTYDMPAEAFPEGIHEIRVDEVSRFGKLISSAKVNVTIKTPDYNGEMYIDNPIQNKRFKSGILEISGWAVSNSPVELIEIYLDGKHITGAERRTRTDIVSLFKNKYSINSDARCGFYSIILTSDLPEGVHTLKVVQYSGYGKEICSQERKFIISNTTTWGMDVSHHNGNIDWNAVKNSGINFAILKIGEYRESSGRIIVDEHFESYYNACKSLGIAVGGYFYSYAFNSEEASHEANAALSIIRGKSFELPIFFDIEDHIVTDAVSSGRTNVENLTNASITFCNIMNANGYRGGVYSYRNFFYSYLNMSALEQYDIWLAHYVPTTDYTGKYDIWQYTSAGSIPGINGAVDLNWCFKRYY